ncbi:MAG: hypothetical protein ACRDHE_12485, partial [Ktedonobacterales bacterium]
MECAVYQPRRVIASSRRINSRLEGLRPRSPAKPDWKRCGRECAVYQPRRVIASAKLNAPATMH